MGRLGGILLAAVASLALLAASAAPGALAANVPAVPGSLGEIPDGDGSSLDVRFDVGGLAGAPTNVAVTISAFHGFTGELVAVLIAPDGSEQIIFSRTGVMGPFESGTPRNLDGTYTFSDAAPPSPTWWEVADGQGPPVPSGSYRASLPLTGANTLITPAFSGLATPNGTWTLRVSDEIPGTGGAISAATLEVTTPPPPAPVLSGTIPASPSPSTTPRVVGAAVGDTRIDIYASADCSGTPLASGPAAELAGAGIAVTVQSEATTQLSASATDADSQVSSCSTPITYTAQRPALQILGVERDRNAGTATLTVAANAGGTLWVAKTKKVKRTKPVELADAGELALDVVPRGGAARKLRRTGRVSVNPRVRFAPAAGGDLGLRRELRLRLDRP